MRVLFLTNIPSPYRIDFFNELSEYCELTVLFERSDAENRNKEWFNRGSFNFKAVFLNGMKFGPDNAINFEVLKYLNKSDYDIIIVGVYSTPTGLLSILYMKLKKIPFILNTDGGLIKKEPVIKKWIKSYFIGSASGWLSTGEKTTEYLLHYGAKKEFTFVYPFSSLSDNELQTHLIAKDEKEKIKNSLNMDHQYVVVAVGSFIERKGFDVLLRACENIDKKVGVYIVGGEPTEKYIFLKETLNLKNTYFAGFKSKEELKKYYMAADLFVLPTREDIWGLVINEAMGNALPVITTDKCIAGLELVENTLNGFIVPVNDEVQLASKINEIIDDDDLRLTMQKTSLNKIKSYTVQNMARKHMEIFRCFK